MRRSHVAAARFFLGALLISPGVAAQTAPQNARPSGTAFPIEECGLELTAAERRQSLAQHYGGAYQLPQSHINRRSAGTGIQYVVPITLHVVRTNSGGGGLSQARLDQAIIDANTAFAPAGIEFCSAGPVDYIDDSFFYDSMSSIDEINMLRMTNVVPGTINIYFVESFPYCGISAFTFSSVQGIVMNNACTATSTNASTFPHEIGHYFDLFHTHEPFYGDECVDGSNCATAGDLVCDTAADPNVLGDVSSSCNYTGNETDPCNGTPYDPPVENYMSYSRKQCRDVFTPGQLDRALATLVNLRPELALPICAGGIETACDPAVPNASGTSASLSVTGTALVSANNMTLHANGLPANTFGIYVNSQSVGAPYTPAQSRGNLCLINDIGRYVQPGQVISSGVLGEISLGLDLTQTPTPFGFTSIAGGQTWAFQLWYRDINMFGGASSNFSNALSITFL